MKFSISNIVLNNGIIVINDLPKNKTHFFTEMEIGIPFVSNLNTDMDVFVTPHFSVNFNGSPINIKGETKPFLASQTTMMNLDLQDIDLKTYFDYIPFKTNLNLTSGKLDLSCALEFSQGENKDSLPQLFLSGQLNIVKLAISDLKAKPLFKMAELNISLKKSEILKGKININDCIISSPNISLSFDDSNQLNLYTLLPENNSDTKENNSKTEKKQTLPIELNIQKFAIHDALATLMDVSKKEKIFSLKAFVIKDTEIKTRDRRANIGSIFAQKADFNIYRHE